MFSTTLEFGSITSTTNSNRNYQHYFDPSSPNLFEYGITFHYYSVVSINSPTYYPLYTLALLNCSQLFVLNVLSLFGKLNDFRLIPTTFFGVAGIIHLLYTQYFDTSKEYPILIYLAIMPGNNFTKKELLTC